jgi:hypothetical protein
MLKLDYGDYLQFAKKLEMDVRTRSGIIAFEGIIWLFDKYDIISE